MKLVACYLIETKYIQVMIQYLITRFFFSSSLARASIYLYFLRKGSVIEISIENCGAHSDLCI